MREVSRAAHVSLVVDKETIGPLALPKLLFTHELHTQTQECFWVIAYDPAINVRSIIEVGRGTYSRVKVHLPAVFGAVLAAGCDRFVVAHNHPTDDPRPTGKDIDLTRALMAGANALGLFLEDHWIVTPKRKSFSFSAAGILIPADYTMEQEAASQ